MWRLVRLGSPVPTIARPCSSESPVNSLRTNSNPPTLGKTKPLVAGALGVIQSTTGAMIKMNQQFSIPGLQKIMMEFQRENEKAELTQVSR